MGNTFDHVTPLIYKNSNFTPFRGPPGGGDDPVYTTATVTPAEVATILARSAPDLMYRFNEASGATELVGTVASADMVDVNTPAKEAASSLGITTTAPTFNTSDSCAAATAGIGNTTTDSLTGILICEFDTTRFGNQHVAHKRSGGAGTNGWEIFQTSAGFLNLILDSATASSTRSIAADHNGVELLQFTNDRANNVSGFWSGEGSNTSTAVAGDMDNAGRLAIGSGISIGGVGRNSASFKAGILMIWNGVSAEGFDGTERATLKTALSL